MLERDIVAADYSDAAEESNRHTAPLTVVTVTPTTDERRTSAHAH